MASASIVLVSALATAQIHRARRPRIGGGIADGVLLGRSSGIAARRPVEAHRRNGDRDDAALYCCVLLFAHVQLSNAAIPRWGLHSWRA